MADQKITAITAITSLTDDDLVPVVNDPGGTPVTNKITWANVKATLLTYFYTIFPANDGWMPVSVTWTYASATTITVPSGAASIYQSGTKIRFKQGGGYKYLPIKTVADTLLTTFTTSDYTVANSAITDIAYSNAETPIGWPGWFTIAAPTWTTTGTAFTNAPTGTTKFNIHGKKCTTVGVYTCNATSGGTGVFYATYVGLPLNTMYAAGSAYNFTTLLKSGYCAQNIFGNVIGMALYDGTALATNSEVFAFTIAHDIA